jgi:hypothetical protein
VTAVALDQAGNRAESSRTWIVDNKFPLLTFSDDGFVVRDTTRWTGNDAPTLTGTVEDENGATVAVTVNGAAIPTTVTGDTWAAVLPAGTLRVGGNAVSVTATDPAGNVNKTELEVTRGSGRLRASLSASLYSIKRSALPEPITLTVSVDDPDGRPVVGATVTFTLSIPGIKTVTGEATTGKNGRAVFKTTIPKGASTGSGSAGAFVRTSEFGKTTDETTITIRK